VPLKVEIAGAGAAAPAVVDSSFFEHQLIAKLKKVIRIICKIFFIFYSKFEMFIKI